MSYCPLTDDDQALRLRMSPGVRAGYSLAEMTDWVAMRVESYPDRSCNHVIDRAYRAARGLPDEARSALAIWSMSHQRAQQAAADLARAEEAIDELL